MSGSPRVKKFLSGKAPYILGFLGWGYHLLILITFYNYISVLAFSGLTITLPSLLMSYKERKEPNFRRILKRRLLFTGFCLGMVTVLFFPNLPRIPSQVHRRIDRCNTLITPDDPKVEEFKDDFLEEQGGLGAFNNLSFRDRLEELNKFVHENIKWTEDIVTRAMAGDLNTPAEAITLGKDDCRGQAVTTVSVLINLGYDAYVVERPWHWYTIVYDGDGKEYVVNPGSYDFEALMMWNNEEVIF